MRISAHSLPAHINGLLLEPVL